MKRVLFVCAAAFGSAAFAAAGAGVQSAPSVRHVAGSKVGLVKRMAPGVVTLPFGKTAAGEQAHLYRILGAGGLVADFTDFGARVVRLYAPDRHGNLADVVTGCDEAAQFTTVDRVAGATIGRVANRIRDGKFAIDGKTYEIPRGAGPFACHGGPQGFDQKIWKLVAAVRRPDATGLKFEYASPDGEMGFPGRCTATVTHWITADNAWRIEYEARVDKKCPVNLTNHAYFNLKGAGEGTVLDHELQIFADQITETDANQLPTGKFLDVKDTPFDFREPHKIGERLDSPHEQLAFGHGYDHNWVLRGDGGKLALAARLAEPTTGRVLEVWTTEPGMQTYACNKMPEGGRPTKGGKRVCVHGAVAFETQHHPDSPNRPEFPGVVLNPGDEFRSTTEYRFRAQ